MQNYSKKIFLIFFTSLLALTATFTSAYANEPVFNQIVFLGDSLSDNGNLFKLSEEMIPRTPPYFKGRFSNGNVWADYVAQRYADKLQISSKNYAIGGETVLPQDFPPFTLTLSIGDYLRENAIADKSKTLFIIWIGANDYLSPLISDPDKLTTTVVKTIKDSIDNLILIGAQNILVMNIPDLSKAPYFHDGQAPQNLCQASNLHNTKLALAVSQLAANHSDVNIHLFEVSKVLDDLLNNLDTFNEKYHAHLTNTTQPCWTGDFTISLNQNEMSRYSFMNRSIKASPSLATAYMAGKHAAEGTICAKPDEYVFWDRVHPTTEVHRIFSEIIMDYISQNYHSA